MALLSDILSQKRPVIIQSSEGGELLKIDATISEGHALKGTLTKHNIEEGSQISDHVHIEPRSLVLQGVISDNPISLNESVVGGAASTLGSIVDEQISPIVTGAVASLGGALVRESSKPSKSAKEVLESIHINKIPVVIITGLDTYINMILINISFPRTSRTTNSLDFNAAFEQVTIVNSDVIQIPKEFIEEAKQVQAAEQKDAGKQTTTDATPEVEQRGSSLLFKLSGVEE